MGHFLHISKITLAGNTFPEMIREAVLRSSDIHRWTNGAQPNCCFDSVRYFDSHKRFAESELLSLSDEPQAPEQDRFEGLRCAII